MPGKGVFSSKGPPSNQLGVIGPRTTAAIVLTRGFYLFMSGHFLKMDFD